MLKMPLIHSVEAVNAPCCICRHLFAAFLFQPVHQVRSMLDVDRSSPFSNALRIVSHSVCVSRKYSQSGHPAIIAIGFKSASSSAILACSALLSLSRQNSPVWQSRLLARGFPWLALPRRRRLLLHEDLAFLRR